MARTRTPTPAERDEILKRLHRGQGVRHIGFAMSVDPNMASAVARDAFGPNWSRNRHHWMKGFDITTNERTHHDKN